jgi:hypothetical protein
MSGPACTEIQPPNPEILADSCERRRLKMNADSRNNDGL